MTVSRFYRLVFPVPCLMALAALLPAEDQPVPFAPPAPVNQPPAAEDQPAAIISPEAAPQGAPATTDGAAGSVAFSAPQRSSSAQPKERRLFSGSVVVGFGRDSNVLQEDTDAPTATDTASLAFSADARVRLHAVDEDHARLIFFGTFGTDQYPSVSQARQLRGGLGLAASGRWGAIDPGVVTGLTKVTVDGDLAANAWNVDPYLSATWKGQVSVIGVQSLYVEYPQSEDLTGTLYSAYYRHWFLLDEQVVNRRIEVALRYGRNAAQTTAAGYQVLTPSAAALWRFGDKPVFGTQDVALRVSWERRTYNGAEGERQRLLQLAAHYDYWLSQYLSIGAQVSFAKRTSSEDLRGYDRTAFGLRIAANW